MALFRVTVAGVIAGLILVGCGTLSSAPAVHSVTEPSAVPSRFPAWVFEPAQEGKIAGVGIAKPHINGKQAQRQLAIERALDEIARQMGVQVTSIQKLSTVGTSSHATTMMESYSLQTTSGKVVTASVKAWWHDDENEELYVWMVAQ
ncbi:MAG: hypothetical protein K6347_04875 [Campylobacterales bacterium]